MKKQYIKPECTLVGAYEKQSLLASSVQWRYECGADCNLWHICRDRCEGKECYDKKTYNW